MPRFFLSSIVVLLAANIALPADLPKDTNPAAHTRNKKLKGKVTLDLKNIPLKEALSEISGQLEDQKLGALASHFALGVSGNTKITYSCKDQTAEEALDGILKQLDLGYHVVSKDKDRYDGWIEISKGTHRGYPPGVEVAKKPEDPKKPEPKVEPKPEPKVDPKPEPKPAPKSNVSPEDEKSAQQKMAEAKKLLEEGKVDDAKVLLKFILRNRKDTTVAPEAKELLDKNK